MNAGGQDVQQTLEYRTATAIVRLLPTGLLLVFLGLLIFALVDPHREGVGTLIGIVLCLVVGSGLIGVALWTRSSHGKPLFTLSPAGIHYRIPRVKSLLIPWSEIRGVDTVDIETGHWSFYSYQRGISIPDYHVMIYRNVTVVLLSKQFYDSRIFVGSFFLRGSGWKANFISKGQLVQMALHHELVSVEPQALREAVEARWHTFRDQPVSARTSVPDVPAVRSSMGAPDNAAVRAAPKSDAVAMGENPRAMSRWEAVKIIALLIGIVAVLTNLAGLWEVPGQGQEREKRAHTREERKYWEESLKRSKEETKKREAEDKERRREFDETMRRAFGR
jgi:hypothetical protein